MIQVSFPTRQRCSEVRDDDMAGEVAEELDQFRDATVPEGLTAHVMPNQAFGSDKTALRVRPDVPPIKLAVVGLS